VNQRITLSLYLCLILTLGVQKTLSAQDPTSTQSKVNQLIEKKAEYHRLTDGEQDGYRIKIHFGADSDKAKTVRSKFAATFKEYLTYEDYQQPNFVVLVGDFKTKLQAYEALKKIQGEFPNSFIVKGRIKVK
jgi:SPOR domain